MTRPSKATLQCRAERGDDDGDDGVAGRPSLGYESHNGECVGADDEAGVSE